VYQDLKERQLSLIVVARGVTTTKKATATSPPTVLTPDTKHACGLGKKEHGLLPKTTGPGFDFAKGLPALAKANPKDSKSTLVEQNRSFIKPARLALSM
jgi:hypothetical protein